MGGNPTKFVDPTGETTLTGVLTGFGADVAIPDPSDVALPKWAAWAFAIGGAILYDALSSDENCEEQERCAAIKKSCIEECTSLLPTNEYSGAPFFKCMRDCMERNGCSY